MLNSDLQEIADELGISEEKFLNPSGKKKKKVKKEEQSVDDKQEE